MPTKKKPRTRAVRSNSTRLPPGTKRADFTPEALEEFDRNRETLYKRGLRARQRHRGEWTRHLLLPKSIHEALDALAESRGREPRFIVGSVLEAAYENVGATTEVYRDGGGDWRWRIRADNHEIIAESGEGYVDRDYCVHMASRFNPLAEVKFL